MRFLESRKRRLRQRYRTDGSEYLIEDWLSLRAGCVEID